LLNVCINKVTMFQDPDPEFAKVGALPLNPAGSPSGFRGRALARGLKPNLVTIFI